MAMRFRIAICVVTPLELLTILEVHFAVEVPTNTTILLRIINRFSKCIVHTQPKQYIRRYIQPGAYASLSHFHLQIHLDC